MAKAFSRARCWRGSAKGYFLDSVDLDCDGSPIIVLATDNGGGFEQTRDELAELNGYGDEE